jgi:uncharacterized protein (TIGR02246 family)
MHTTPMNPYSMSTVLAATLCALLCLLGGCEARQESSATTTTAPHPSRSNADPAAAREAIMALERSWSAMYGGGDVEGIADLLAQDTVLLAPGSGIVRGRDQVIAATRAMIANEESENVLVAWEPEDAFVSESGDMAYDYGRSTATLSDGSVIEGTYLVVWRKERGVWKVVADIFQ